MKYAHSLASLVQANEISFYESEVEDIPERSQYKYQLIVEDLDMVDEYANDEKYRSIDVLGLPSSLCDGDKEARIKFLEENDYHDRFEFHCLGTSKWLNEIYYLNARSISTSYPVYMGLLGLNIETDEWKEKPFWFDECAGITEEVYDNIRYYTRLVRSKND